MIRCWAISLAITVVLTAEAQPLVRPELSEETRALVDGALQLRETWKLAWSSSRAERRSAQARAIEAGLEFAKALDALAAGFDEQSVQSYRAQENAGITEKLVCIAWDRGQRRKLYDDIEDYYVWCPRVLGARVHSSPPVQDKHTTPEYRLVWEYYLLAPGPSKPSPDERLIPAPGFEERVFTALRKVADERTLPCLRYCFEWALSDGVSADYFSRVQGACFSIMGEIQTPRSLALMLECLDLAEKNKPRIVAERRGANPYDPTGLVERILTNIFVMTVSGERVPLRGDRWKKWLPILEAFPKGNLPEYQQRLLERVIKVGHDRLAQEKAEAQAEKQKETAPKP